MSPLDHPQLHALLLSPRWSALRKDLPDSPPWFDWQHGSLNRLTRMDGELDIASWRQKAAALGVQAVIVVTPQETDWPPEEHLLGKNAALLCLAEAPSDANAAPPWELTDPEQWLEDGARALGLGCAPTWTWPREALGRHAGLQADVAMGLERWRQARSATDSMPQPEGAGDGEEEAAFSPPFTREEFMPQAVRATSDALVYLVQQFPFVGVMRQSDGQWHALGLPCDAQHQWRFGLQPTDFEGARVQRISGRRPVETAASVDLAATRMAAQTGATANAQPVSERVWREFTDGLESLIRLIGSSGNFQLVAEDGAPLPALRLYVGQQPFTVDANGKVLGLLGSHLKTSNQLELELLSDA